MLAPVTARGAALEPGIPQRFVRIFANNTPHTGGDYQTYAVSADGNRILIGPNRRSGRRRWREGRHRPRTGAPLFHGGNELGVRAQEV